MTGGWGEEWEGEGGGAVHVRYPARPGIRCVRYEMKDSGEGPHLMRWLEQHREFIAVVQD